MERNKVNILIVFLLIGMLGISSLALVQQLNYVSLNSEYQKVLSEYDDVDTLYDQAIADYTTLMSQYQEKIDSYDELNQTYTLTLSAHAELVSLYGIAIAALIEAGSDLNALNQTYLSLLAEFELLNMTYYILLGEFESVNATYTLLLDQYAQLNNTYYDSLDVIELLQSELDTLNSTYYSLLDAHGILQGEYDLLLIDFDSLNITYLALLDAHADLQAEYDVLQSDYDNLWVNYNSLWLAHNQLQNDMDALQALYNQLQLDYNQLQTDYDMLYDDYLLLQVDYTALNASYWHLHEEYYSLETNYTSLYADYQALNTSYWVLNISYAQLQLEYDVLDEAFTIIGNWITSLALPVKALYFGEAVRRYYLPIYLEEAWNQGLDAYWTNFTKFMADVVYYGSAWRTDSLTHSIVSHGAGAHGSEMHKFLNVEEILYNALGDGDFAHEWVDGSLSGNTAYALNWYVMRNIWGYSGWMQPIWSNGTHNLPVWWGDNPDSMWIENRWECPFAIHQWVVDNIDYEYDTDITRRRYQPWDYIKLPVETAFRTLGDCEDQAILDAAFLRSCGFQVAIGVFHDTAHPTIGAFYHTVLWINMDFNGDGDHLDIGESPVGTPIWWHLLGSPQTWICLDPTWDVSLGNTPGWLQDYIDHGITDFGSDKLHVEILTPPT